jgi:hypothetical protein
MNQGDYEVKFDNQRYSREVLAGALGKFYHSIQ